MLNTRLICHLPLIVPPGCGFRVGNETREWEEGKLLIFDDTIEHEAWNESDQDRVVLIFDIWRPELSEADAARGLGLPVHFRRSPRQRRLLTRLPPEQFADRAPLGRDRAVARNRGRSEPINAKLNRSPIPHCSNRPPMVCSLRP